MKKKNSKQDIMAENLQQEVAIFPEAKKEMMRHIYQQLQARQMFLLKVIETFHINHKLLQKTMHWNEKAITVMAREDICDNELMNRLELAIIFLLREADLQDYEPASSLSDKCQRQDRYKDMEKEWNKKHKLDPWKVKLEILEYELDCKKTFYHSMTGRSGIRLLNALWQLDQKAGLIQHNNK